MCFDLAPIAGKDKGGPVVRRREGAVLIAPSGEGPSRDGRIDKTLVKAVVLARAWASALAAGQFESVKDLARHYNLCPAHTMRLAPLGYLAPDLVVTIIEGRHAPTLCLKSLTASPLPLDWRMQREAVRAICMGRS